MEVEKNSLSELFQRDPLSLNDTDIERVCKELRGQRDRWMQDEVKAKNKPKKIELSKGEMDDLLNLL